MHKSYQPILPAANKLLQQRWDSKYYSEHRKLVYDAKPMVDTRAPQTYMHLYLKLKKLQLEEERLATIERDNRILLEKMAYIMRTRGRVDNRNDYESKSLNREKRQRELLRVTRENQEILRRISGRQPEYSHERWEQDWQENLKYMDAISQYPKDWWLRRSMTSLSLHSFKKKEGQQEDSMIKSGSRSRASQNNSRAPSSRATARAESQQENKKLEESASEDKTEEHNKEEQKEEEQQQEN